MRSRYQLVKRVRLESAITALSLSDDGLWLVSGGQWDEYPCLHLTALVPGLDGAHLWSVTPFKVIASPGYGLSQEISGVITSTAWAPTKKAEFLAIGTTRGSLIIWKIGQVGVKMLHQVDDCTLTATSNIR